MNYLRKVLLVVMASVILFSCKDVVDPSEKEIAIYGKVTDQNDNLISGVNVHYIFSLGRDVEIRNAVITYGLITGQTIFMQILDINNNEVAKPIDQVYHQPGTHAFLFDGSNLTNGIYHYKVAGSTVIKEGSFILLTLDVNKLRVVSPLTISDNSGEFKLNYEKLGIGKKFSYGGYATEFPISDSITFVLQKTGYQDLTVAAKLDTTKVFEKTFKMVKNN